MAKIQFEIGSVFRGEGFNKAAKAVQGTARSAKDAVEAVGNMSGGLSQMEGAAGKAADGVSKLAGVLASGTPWGIAASAITLVVTSIIKWRQEAEKAAEAHRKMMEDMARGYQERLAKSIDGAARLETEALQKMADDAMTALKSVDALAGAWQKVYTAEAQAAEIGYKFQSANIDLATNVALGQSTSDHDKAVIQAQAARLKADVEQARATEALTREIDMQRESMNVATQKQQALADAVAAQRDVADDATKTVKRLKTRLDENRNGMEAAKAIQDQLNRALDNEKAQRAKLADLRTQEQKAAIEANAGRQNLKNAEDKLALVEIEGAAKQEAINNTLASLDQKLLEVQMKWGENIIKANALGEKENSLTWEQNDKIKALRNEALKHEKKAAEIENQQARAKKGMLEDLKRHRGISGNGYNYQLDENGNISRQADFDRAARYADNANRNKAQRDAKQATKDAQMDAWVKEIDDKLKRGDYVSDTDIKKANQHEARRNQQRNAQAEQKKADAAKAEADKLQKQLSDDVKKIREEIEQLKVG